MIKKCIIPRNVIISVITTRSSSVLYQSNPCKPKVKDDPYACKKPEKKEVKEEPKPVKKGPPNPRKTFKIYRYSGDPCSTPKTKNYELDITTCGPMMLHALIKIKEMDPTLVFRYSCREGICGSCGINLQGQNCLACITPIPETKDVAVTPLPHMYVVRDLVVDFTHFINAYNNIRPYLIRTNVIENATEQYAQSINDSMKMVGLYECILCACCSTSCPSYWWNGRRFLGPAALLHAYRWIIDSRDEDAEQRLAELKDDFKAFRCHTILQCNLACPKNLMPGTAIAKLKRLIAGLDKKEAPNFNAMKFAEKPKKCT